jgi:hypothetical protein
MSFEISVGNILAVTKLAKKIRKDFVGAPAQCSDISNVYVAEIASKAMLIR